MICAAVTCLASQFATRYQVVPRGSPVGTVHRSLNVCSPGVSGFRVCARIGRMSLGVPMTPLETPSHRAVTLGVRVVTLAWAGTVTPMLILTCSPGVTANLGIRLPCGCIADWPLTRTVNDRLNGTTPGRAIGGVL